MKKRQCAAHNCASPAGRGSFCPQHSAIDKMQGVVPTLDAAGYLRYPDTRLVHRVIAEAAIRRHLPITAPVHHVNGCKTDNRPGNLVICPDEDYHQLIHERTRAYEACTHADWVFCWRCYSWAPRPQMEPRADGYLVHQKGRCGTRRKQPTLPWGALLPADATPALRAAERRMKMTEAAKGRTKPKG